MPTDICQINVIHQDKVAAAKAEMPEDAALSEMAEVFRILGDLSRIRILQALNTTELCVCDLAAILETTSSAVSHQLRLLRAHGMVRFRKEGKIVYYSLADGPVRHLLTAVFQHVQKS